jgi:DNA mismatch repair protein MutL
MPSIRVLDPEVIAKIRAGEVIDRPAAVAKELIENALDAGSRLVAVQASAQPERSIRVQDDGSGMTREDTLLAVRRHATSKLERAEDLASIRTLGFRGEALGSIAEVSRLTLSTRSSEDLTGTQIEILGGTVISVSGVGRAVGTTIAVEDLFFNTPARLRFLRSRDAEVRALTRVFWSYALIAPQVHWRFRVEGREDNELPAAVDLLERWQLFYGRGAGEGAALFEEERSGILCRGILGAPEIARAHREHQIFAVNGRVVASPSMGAALRQGYGNLVPGDRHPIALVLIELDPARTDVNVHPTKREIRFREEAEVFQTVRGAVESAMKRYVPVALALSSETEVLEEGSAGLPLGRGTATEGGLTAPTPGGHTPAPGAQPHLDWDGIAAARTLYAPPEGLPGGGETIRERLSAGDVRESLAEPEIPIWQLHDRYLLAPIRGGLVVVDQHAAHERILYEEARVHLFGDAASSQHLLFPRVLEVTKEELETLLALEPHVRRLGYEVSLFGEREIAVRGVPASLPEETALDALTRLLAGEESHGAGGGEEPPEERIAKTYACHAAVRSGQPLSPEERRALFDRLFATSLPHGDPHGRPTYVRIPMEELDRRFGRR